jgi:RNA polymerase sigma-70 factor (ECF subfamily)
VVLNRRELLGRTNVVTEAANAQPAVHPRLLDRQLVTRCLAHDALAERALYDAHVERIYRLMHRMAGDADLAADFTQETFIRAFERLEQFRGDSSLATWLHTIAVSIALNGMRKVNRTQGRTEMIDDVPSLAAETFRFTGDLKARLHAAIDALSAKLRPVFVMHDVEGYTHEEIAGSLGIPVGTSKARLFDARAKLRVALAAFAGDHIA